MQFINSTIDDYVKQKKLTGQEDLGEKLMFGQDDEDGCKSMTTSLLHDISFDDLEQLLTCDNFKPSLFINYLNLINMVQNLKLDCADALSSFFENTKIEKLPEWIK